MAERRVRPKGTRKISRVMGEFKRGTLRSSSGRKVTKPAQAKAIALSEQRRADKQTAKRRRA